MVRTYLLCYLAGMEKTSSSSSRLDLTLRIIRVTGALLLIFGALVFFDLGGIADMIGIGGEPGVMRVFGGALMFTGLIDIFVIPYFIAQVKPK